MCAMLQGGEAACCEKCQLHAKGSGSSSSGGKACNTWAYCGDAKKCGDKLGSCELRWMENPTLPQPLRSGPGESLRQSALGQHSASLRSHLCAA